VGYSETSKAYRLDILVSRRVVVRWDVKFEEERAFRRLAELDEREPRSPQQQESSPQGPEPQSLGSQRPGGTRGLGGTGMSGVT
jgi:hypothetical protein